MTKTRKVHIHISTWVQSSTVTHTSSFQIVFWTVVIVFYVDFNFVKPLFSVFINKYPGLFHHFIYVGIIYFECSTFVLH